MLSSTSNERVKLVRALQSQRKTREKEGRFVVEGTRLVEEAMLSSSSFDFVFYIANADSRAQTILDKLAKQGATAIEVSPQVMRACSDTEHPQPILAVIPFPTLAPHSNSLILICDRLSDPGNLGTLLRTASAARVDSAILAPGTVDAFNPKVVRGSMGAHFRVPIEPLGWNQIRERVKGLKVWLAEASTGTQYDQVDWTQPSAVIIGSEAEGPSDDARALAHASVFIPMPGGSESLNAAVAGSVMLFEAVRQLLSPK
ncbi:MAG TPA: RNA methyltransferase [Anaerolineales bacterium]|nr:RNA methyltransferase [Anaerolineales bacterium]